MDSPTGTIPEELMSADKRQEVIAFLVGQPLPGYIRRSYLFAWARTVGVRLQESDVVAVLNAAPQPEGRL